MTGSLRMVGPAVAGALAVVGLVPVMTASAASPGTQATRIELSVPTTTVVAGIGVTLNARPVNARGAYAPVSAQPRWTATPSRGVALRPDVGPFTTFVPKVPGRYRVRVREDRLTASVGLRVVANTVPTDLATLTLVLAHPQPGSRLQALLGVPAIPAGMPPALGPVTVTVPRYPGARPIVADPRRYPSPIPWSWYLAASPVRAFYLPAAQGRVLSWYDRAFSALGFDRTGGSVSSRHGVVGYSYAPASGPNAETVSVLTRPSGSGTEVLYGATWTRVPPRPSASVWALPRVPRLVVTYRGGDGPTRRLVVTQAAWRTKLVEAVNAMTLAAGRPFSCPMMIPGHRVTVTIATAHYPTVHLSNGCGEIGRIGGLRLDGGNRLLAVIQALVKGGTG